MVIEIGHNASLIEIPAKLQEFDDKYKDKLNLRIILSKGITSFLSMSIIITDSKYLPGKLLYCILMDEFYEKEIERNLYWKEGVLEAIDNLVKITGKSKEKFIKENLDYFITTEITSDFYKTEIIKGSFLTGNTLYIFQNKYSESMLNNIEKEIIKLL